MILATDVYRPEEWHDFFIVFGGSYTATALATLGEHYLKRPRHFRGVKAKRPSNRAYRPHNDVPPTLDIHATLRAVAITAATSTDENTAPARQPGGTDAIADFDHIDGSAIK